MRGARTLRAVLGGGLLFVWGLPSCRDASESPHANGDQGGGASSLAGAGQVATHDNGGSTAGGKCSNCMVSGDAGATSRPLGACRATADPTPSLPEPTSLDPDAVARAAAVLGSCVADDGIARTATRIWLGHFGADLVDFRLVAQLDCLANAACGCKTLEQCYGWKHEATTETCTGSCEGSVFHACGNGTKLTFDCAPFGFSCSPVANCISDMAAGCTVEAPRCTGDGDVSFCDLGFWRVAPCASLGFNCVDGKCTGDGDPCSADTTSSVEFQLSAPVGTGCRGNVLEACLGGRATTLSCAEQGPGFTCQTVGDAHFCGLGADCVPADAPYEAVSEATCNGTLLDFCNAGRREQIECRSLGFEGCDIDPKNGHYGCTPGDSLAPQ